MLYIFAINKILIVIDYYYIIILPFISYIVWAKITLLRLHNKFKKIINTLKYVSKVCSDPKQERNIIHFFKQV